MISEDIDKKMLCLYSLGMSHSGIQQHFKDIYDFGIYNDTITAITNRLPAAIKEWQHRALKSVYAVAWLDAIHFKVRHDGTVKNQSCIFHPRRDNRRTKRGDWYLLWGERGRHFWRSVLTDLKQRSVEDIFIAFIDNLSGFGDAIEDIFPQTDVQLCLVHEMRNSMKYIKWKDLKTCVKDLEHIYTAANEEMGPHYLNEAEKNWGNKYAVVFRSWRCNWQRLSPFFLLARHPQDDLYHQSHRKLSPRVALGDKDQSCLHIRRCDR